jgi:pimeloyl-ACP methyl ester carboxylesterase
MTRLQESETYLGEKPFYFSVYDSGASDWLVIVPPLFEELARTRKLLVNAARAFAASGFNVARFDYYGTGLSEGRFEDFAPSQATRDLDTVVSFCRAHGARQVSLVGVRYGAYLAAQHVRGSDLANVVVWEPILDPAAYMAEVLKSTAVDQIMTYGEVRIGLKESMDLLDRDGRILISGYGIGLAAVQELRNSPALTSKDCERLGVVIWRKSTLSKTPFLAELAPTLCANVKAAWDHIKYLDHDPQALVEATLALLKRQ